jgi:light-harvesting complex 1 beta chain
MSSLSGLTADEAKAFHSLYMQSFVGFLIVSAIAHFLIWPWQPWF